MVVDPEMKRTPEPFKACKILKRRPNDDDPDSNKPQQRRTTTSRTTGKPHDDQQAKKKTIAACVHTRNETTPPSTTTDTQKDDRTLLFSSRVPLADWKAIQEVISLIRTKQFRQLCKLTNYPYQTGKGGREGEEGGKSYYSVGQPIRSCETLVPRTRHVRIATTYHYYDTTTGREIPSDEYQIRYEQAVTKVDWRAYFSQLRFQKSLQSTASTVAIQIQQSREDYAAKLVEWNYEKSELYDSDESMVEDEHPYDETDIGPPWFEAYV